MIPASILDTTSAAAASVKVIFVKALAKAGAKIWRLIDTARLSDVVDIRGCTGALG